MPRKGRSSSSSSSWLRRHRQADDGMSYDTLNLKDILFTSSRDHLVKNNGERVFWHELAGSTVVILIVGLWSPFHPPSYDLGYDLLQIHNLLSARAEQFEVIIIMAGDDIYPPSIEGLEQWFGKEPAKRFDEMLSLVPWPTIPYYDQQSRENIREKLIGSYDDELPQSLIICPTGRVLARGESSRSILSKYGDEGYPFTIERINYVQQQDQAVWENISLSTLLPGYDLLVAGKTKKVYVSGLEHKHVGFFFYQNEGGNDSNGVRNIKKTYKKCKSLGLDFEIILIYLDFAEDPLYLPRTEKYFWKNLERLGCLALPFQDPNCRRLHRIFNYPSMNSRAIMPIVGPYGSSMEIFGFDIICRYGIDAYPFNLEAVVEVEMKNLMNLSLDDIFSTDDVLTRNDSSKVFGRQLFGTRVLILFHNTYNFTSEDFIKMVEEQYFRSKGTLGEFEVVYVFFELGVADDESYAPQAPWLVPSNPLDFFIRWAQHLFKRCNGISVGLIAFERDGHFLGMDSVSGDMEVFSTNFPFITSEMRSTIHENLTVAYDWNFSFGAPLDVIEPIGGKVEEPRPRRRPF